jgi:hypothetical protein
MIKFMIKTIKEFGKEYRVKPLKCGDGTICYAYYMWIHEKGEDAEFFGGEDVCKRHPELKMWVSMGGSNMTYYDDNGKQYRYPVPYYTKLLEAIAICRASTNKKNN